jgi:hypothetical protein
MAVMAVVTPTTARAQGQDLDRAMWALGALGEWGLDAASAPVRVQAQAWEGGPLGWEATAVTLTLADGAATAEAQWVQVVGDGGRSEGRARGVVVSLDVAVVCGRWPASAVCEVARWSPTLRLDELTWGDSLRAQGVSLTVRPCGDASPPPSATDPQDPQGPQDPQDPQGALNPQALAARTHRLRADAATWAAGALTLEGVEVSPCVCDADGEGVDAGGVGLSLRLERWTQPVDGQARPYGEGARLSALGVSWPVWGGVIMEDGRASGLLPPRLGYSGAMGWYAALPLFWRLGTSADLTTELGWASSLGLTGQATTRWAMSDTSRGALTLGGALDWGPWQARAWWRGAGRAQVGAAAVIMEADGVSDWPLYWATASDLDARSKRYGRSRLGVGLDSPSLHLWMVTDLLQVLPRDAARVGGPPSAGWGADAPTFHRLPWASLGWWVRLRPWLRWDLDTDYVYGRRLSGGGFADWGPRPWEGALGWWPDLASPTADGSQGDAEPFDRAHLLALRASLMADVSLWGYAHLSAAAALSERMVFHDRAQGEQPSQVSSNRDSALSLAATLDTSLRRRDGDGVSLIEPSLAWRWVPKRASSTLLGAPSPWTWRAPAALDQTLEAAITSRWLSPRARLRARLGVLAAWDDPLRADLGCATSLCALAIASARVEWLPYDIDLSATAHLSLDDPSQAAARAVLSWRAPAGLRLGLSHAIASAFPLWLDAPPSDLAPASPWRRLSAPEASTSTGDATSVSGASIGWRAPSWGIQSGLLWAWQADPDAEVTLSADYTPACGCWRLGLSSARHMTSPRWDAALSLSLDLNP